MDREPQLGEKSNEGCFPFEEVFARIASAFSIHSQVELAEALAVKQSVISDAKRRNRIPLAWILKLCDLHGVNPDCLTQGNGPTHPG